MFIFLFSKTQNLTLLLRPGFRFRNHGIDHLQPCFAPRLHMSGLASLCELVFARLSAHCAYRRVYSESRAESEASSGSEAGVEPEAGAAEGAP